jgi:hypothetical protein
MVSAHDLQAAIEAEANKPDNKLKRATNTYTEQHLFVYVDQLNTRAWQAMINRCIPEQPPTLPAQITHVWAAAETPEPDVFVVWSAAPPNGWQDHGMVPNSPSLRGSPPFLK